MWGQILLAFVVLLSLTSAAHDDSICVKGQDQPVPPAKPFPQIPDVFQVDIQMNVVANKTTKHLFEVFDAPNRRALIGETLAAGPYKNISVTGYDIYNFYTNQIAEVFPLPDSTFDCNAMQIDGKGRDTFMFGGKINTSSPFSGRSAFMTDPKYPPVYMGKDTLDNGVMVEKWGDCHYIPIMDATVRVTWYFNDVDAWVSPLGVQVPIMLKVQGKSYHPNVKGRTIDHSYTFTGFQDFISDRGKMAFMVPQGTICPYLKSFNVGQPQPHPLPAIASQGFFSFNAEFVQMTGDGTGLVTGIREFYDSTLKMSRYDYDPQGMLVNFYSPATGNEISEIHDFVTGLAYIKDRVRGNCTVTPLANVDKFDVKGTAGNHVRMKTVAEFFGLTNTADASVNWTYTGQRKVRDVLADFYIAEKLGYPAGSDPKTKSIWEIAFMSDTYLDVARTTELELGEPVRLWVKIPDLDYEMSYNIFGFDETEPSTFRFDIGDCVPDNQKTNVRFRFPGDQKDKMENNRQEFTYWLLISIIGYMDILPSRVTKLEWYANDNDNDVTVRFQILDPPTILGSTTDKLPSSYMNPTTDAVAVLKAGIDSSKFVVETGSLGDGTIVPVIAIPGSMDHSRNTLPPKTVEKKVLDAGIAAGIAVGCLVGGMGLGVLLIFIINKVRGPGNSAPSMTLSFTPKTFER